MIGAVIGDVVGSVYEGNNTRDYQFRMFSSQSNYTDDTIMTMAVAEWILYCQENNLEDFPHAVLERSMVEMACQYPCPAGGYGGGFRRWLFHPELLLDYRTGKPSGKRCPYHSYGNGSAMRASAVGWLLDTQEEVERVAAISASITHDHPEGIKGAQVLAIAVFMARKGRSKEEIKSYIETRYGYDLNDTWEHLNRTYRWDSSCQGSVPQAIIAFLESTDFESAIRLAVSIGGDSDTIACMTGAVAEAFYGEIPQYMLEKVTGLLPEKFKELIRKVKSGGK